LKASQLLIIVSETASAAKKIFACASNHFSWHLPPIALRTIMLMDAFIRIYDINDVVSFIACKFKNFVSF